MEKKPGSILAREGGGRGGVFFLGWAGWFLSRQSGDRWGHFGGGAAVDFYLLVKKLLK